MAFTRLAIDGNGQIELNNVAFRRDGRIEAQCKLSVAAENGMILAVDTAKREVCLPKAEGEDCPLAVVYTSEHIYSNREVGLKNFINKKGSYPRMGYPAIHDIWTTNTIGYDSSEFTSNDKVVEAIKNAGTKALYGKVGAEGVVTLTATKPTSGLCFKVATGMGAGSMPDGQVGVKLEVIGL
jgi:hypothetical protein